MDIPELARKAGMLPLEEKLRFINSLRRLLEAGGGAPPEIINESIQRSKMIGAELALPGIQQSD